MLLVRSFSSCSHKFTFFSNYGPTLNFISCQPFVFRLSIVQLNFFIFDLHQKSHFVCSHVFVKINFLSTIQKCQSSIKIDLAKRIFVTFLSWKKLSHYVKFQFRIHCKINLSLFIHFLFGKLISYSITISKVYILR